ncbi:MAG: hypothetical protein JO170_03670 [Verrucomicrobia bacterium]|nr:hypothetical protein [Verrucomicrobiota bacterium]
MIEISLGQRLHELRDKADLSLRSSRRLSLFAAELLLPPRVADPHLLV